MNRGIILTQGRGALTGESLVALAQSGADETVYYRSVEGPVHSAVVQYCGSDLLERAITTEAARYVCREVCDSGPSAEVAPVLMIVAFDVPAERQQSVERWYDVEHIPLLCRAPGWLRARRYEVQSCGGGPRYSSIALHELRNVKVLDSAERAYARATAWRASMSAEAWFMAAGRYVYERVPAPPGRTS